MSEITESVARRLRMRGYDAVTESWDGLGGAPVDVVAVNAILVIGWRYPDATWKWDDRPAYLVDKGIDPLARFTHPPYYDSSHRWDWLASRPGTPEEHPRDDATGSQLAIWIQRRLPPPARPYVLKFSHPHDVDHQPAPGTASHPNLRVWPWTSDWEKAWDAAEEPQP